MRLYFAMNTKFTGLLAFCLVACGAYSGELDPNDEAELEVAAVGTTSQALLERLADRPVAAATTRMVNGTEQIWVFACDANDSMRRRVKAGGVWGSWFNVGNSSTNRCLSAPSVGKWRGGTPNEVVFAYWRGTGNKLIEAYYDSNGVGSSHNVSDVTGFGTIVGAPVIADTIDVNGASQRISVAVRASDHSLYTWDYYQGVWHQQPIVDTDGSTINVGGAISPTKTFMAKYAAGYTRNYLSIQTDATTHMIFTRSLWSQSYAKFAWTKSIGAGVGDAGMPAGALTIGGGFLPQVDCRQFGCAMYRDNSTDHLKYKSLQFGGSYVPSSYSVWNVQTLGGSPYSTPAGKISKAYARTSSGSLYLYDFESNAASASVGGSVGSAPSLAVDSNLHVFYCGPSVGAGCPLFYYYLANGGNPAVSLGLNVRTGI